MNELVPMCFQAGGKGPDIKNPAVAGFLHSVRINP